MADYELSNKADEDLNDIYLFSYRRFGAAKTDAYLVGLNGNFQFWRRSPVWGAGSTTFDPVTSDVSTPATPSSTG
jgi:plasmid stabilization system protein ParE